MSTVSDGPEEPKSLAVQLKEKASNFAAALPAHIPAERFARVVLTAIQNNPDLAKADRPSLWNACMRAAQDGLLPDGRDGALVIYNTKSGSDWIAKVQWMPMIGGIRKKVRNSDTIATWDVQTVHAKDEFAFELGDDPYIKHKPHLGDDRGPMIAVYSVAVLKSGEKSRDVMSKADVDLVRDTYAKKDRQGAFSAAWTKSYDEMAKKTVARRHSKVLPMSSDLDDLLRRDEVLYDLDGKSDKVRGPKSLSDKIDRLVASPNIEHDPETGEIAEDAPTDSAATSQADAPQPPQGSSEGAGPRLDASGPALTDRDAAILADLLETGAGRAEGGPAALREFLDGLETHERRLIPPAIIEEWVKGAKAAKAG